MNSLSSLVSQVLLPEVKKPYIRPSRQRKDLIQGPFQRYQLEVLNPHELSVSVKSFREPLGQSFHDYLADYLKKHRYASLELPSPLEKRRMQISLTAMRNRLLTRPRKARTMRSLVFSHLEIASIPKSGTKLCLKLEEEIKVVKKRKKTCNPSKPMVILS